jgi:methyl-accepting chemotaxis protein
VLTFLCVVGVLMLIVGGVLFVIMIRRLSTSRHVIVSGRVDLVRAKARADAAERVAMQITNVAGQAVEQVGQALHVAREIEKVSSQMDELLEYVTDYEPKRGRHHAALRIVPGQGDVA